MAGPIERAIRATTREGEVLGSVSRSVPFVVGEFRTDALVLLVGAKAWQAVTPWEAIEKVPGFLRGRGQVKVGSVHSNDVDPDSFDAFLRPFVTRSTASYLPVILERAGVVEVDKRRPASLRLRDAWRPVE